MLITVRCHPLLEPLLPAPVLAAQGLPGWLSQMPAQTQAASLGGASVRTLKHCPPLIDAMRLGVLILCPTDITVKDGAVSWDWDPPILHDADISRAPVGVHVPEQAQGSPLASRQLILKFMNFWTLRTPPDWSLLFVHPLGYPDLPFTTLGGVVDCDRYGDGYVHFPALLDLDFEGVIAKGTPIAQAVPVQKSVTLDVGTMSSDQIARNRAVQAALSQAPGHYRKTFHR